MTDIYTTFELKTMLASSRLVMLLDKFLIEQFIISVMLCSDRWKLLLRKFDNLVHFDHTLYGVVSINIVGKLMEHDKVW